jgi:hypothetical protein
MAIRGRSLSRKIMNCEFSSSTLISVDQYQYAKMDCSFSETTIYFLGFFTLVATIILVLKLFK